MITFDNFLRQFKFTPMQNVLQGFRVGIEREAFLFDPTCGAIVPQAPSLIAALRESAIKDQVSPELSACQVEVKTEPLRPRSVARVLVQDEQVLNAVAADLGFKLMFQPVAPADMRLDVYPKDRYRRIAEQIPETVLAAGCRVAGTHIHVSASGQTVLDVYNDLVDGFDDWLNLAGGYGTERMQLYREVTDRWRPVRYESWEDFYQHACESGFVDDLRSCWSLIRITAHGTIEFRMFDSTASVAEIDCWAQRCHKRCVELHDKHRARSVQDVVVNWG